jgi:GAF domain
VHSPWVAIDLAADPVSQARLLRRAHEVVLSGCGTPPVLREVVVSSWARCLNAGVDPDRPAPMVLDADAVAKRFAAHPLAPAVPLIRGLLGSVSTQAHHLVAVGDADGVLLWSEGHPGMLEAAAAPHFTPGALCTETGIGTNAIGTALVLRHAVQIFSAEHFLSEQHAWWCSAAPIHDPVSGEVLGVVDLSGPMRTAHPVSLALVAAAAGMAEEALRVRRVTASARRPELRLSLLGRGRLEARLGDGPALELSMRHAEILALLTLYPDGLTGEELTLHLYGDHGNRVSTRAEMSRLRKLLGPCVAAKPYRLLAEVAADFLTVEERLSRGDLEGALSAYRGPLLPASEAPRIEQARDELEGALQRAARAGTAEQLWAWLQTAAGREDPLAMAEFVHGTEAADPRRPVVVARLSSLERRWGL